MAAPCVRCAGRLAYKNSYNSQLCLQVSSYPLAGKVSCRQASQTAEQIVIPQKIHRSDTAILEALSSTVKKDYNGPHYKFMDDPFLIPHSALEKRSYALSRASGQKAAKYVMETYPKYFTHDIAAPSVEAYLPPKVAVKAADTEAGILERITLRRPVDAYDAYQQACQAGVHVSGDTVASLMELLSAYNSQEPGPPLRPDEQFFRVEEGQDFTKKIVKTWQSNGFAEQLFDSLPEKDARCYNALIQGRAKFFDYHKSYELYLEAQDKKIPLTLATYNRMIGMASFLREKADMSWDLVQEFLKTMVANDISPNLTTFNHILYVLSRNRSYSKSAGWAMQVMQEIKTCGIEPCLGSWYYLIHICYRHEDTDSELLSSVVKQLEGKEFTYQHPADLEFFAFSMARCCYQLKDMELAYRIDKVLNHGNNIRLVGNGFKEGVYYTSFLKLLCVFEQIETIMEHYTRITPNAYTPTMGALEELLTALDLNEGYQYLPQIWSDMVLFDQTRNLKFVELLLNLMGKKKHDDKLQEHFMVIAQAMVTRVEEDSKSPRLIKPLLMSGSMIGNLIRVGLNSSKNDFAWDIFYLYYTKRFQIDGFPEETALEQLAKSLIKDAQTEKLMNVLEVMSDLGFPKLDALKEEAGTALELTELEKNRLGDF